MNAASSTTVGNWERVPGVDGLWSAYKRQANGWGLRTVAVRLRSGALAVVSPTRGLGDDAHRALAALGKPAVLVAPNHFHYLGLREWTERYPGCTAVAGSVALPRLAKRAGVRVEGLEALRGELPERVGVLEPAGTRAGEVWLRAEGAGGVAWVVSDAFFHCVERPTGAMGLFCRVTRTAPGLCVGWTFLTVGLRDRSAYRAWVLAACERDGPSVLVPGHGEVAQGAELAQRVKRVVEERVR